MTFHILPKRTDRIHPKYSDILYSLRDGKLYMPFCRILFFTIKILKKIFQVYFLGVKQLVYEPRHVISNNAVF